MMRNTTINRLNTVAQFLIRNAGAATRSECAAANQKNLFDLLKYAVRKEKRQLAEATGVNVINICKTTRQFNWLANEAAYGIRKRFNDMYIRNAWDVA